MPRFQVRHFEPVWETTSFFVDLPETLPEGYSSYKEYVEDHFVDLMEEVLKDGRATIEVDQSIRGMDSDLEVEPTF